MSITISHPTGQIIGEVNLPLSKSESNRILILQALSKGKIETNALSDARDTKLLQAALYSDPLEINIEDAGTAMRFLTAYYCATGQHKILTGSARMQQRPIAVLVDALREIGFDISYLKNDGYPPLEIKPSNITALKNRVEIASNVSSQYISALSMIAPVLPVGLTISFTSGLSSKPYVELTLDILSKAGIKHSWYDNELHIAHQPFQKNVINAHADWSAASYWFSISALAKQASITLNGLTFDTAQGDKVIAEWCKNFGINVQVEAGGLLVHSAHSNNPINHNNPTNHGLHFDFTHHPDLAQTMIVMCAAKNIGATFTGLDSLRIKETDRIAALQNELLKFGVILSEIEKGFWQLSGSFYMSHQTIKTYNDHRMAMAMAPLALLGEITIEQPEVVAKSYPNFWQEMGKKGFEIISNTPQ